MTIRFRLLILFLLLTVTAQWSASRPAPSTLTVQQITTEQGLTQDSVTAILQDRQGFIWLGTTNGLNRWDGYQIVQYQNDPDDPGSISHNRVYCLREDHRGIIWIGTAGGLNRFDPRSELFTHFNHRDRDPDSINSDFVFALLEDSQHRLWVGTEKGVNRFDGESRQFFPYPCPGSAAGETVDFAVIDFLEASDGNLWIAGYGDGLKFLKVETGEYTHYRHSPDDPGSLSHDLLYGMTRGPEGFLWIGAGNGLNRFDPQTRRCKRYMYQAKNPRTISHPIVNFVLTGPKGFIWVGTEDGLDRFDPRSETFVHYTHNPCNPRGLTSDCIYSLFIDPAENLWIGTHGGGVNMMSLNAPSIDLIQHRETDPRGLSKGGVMPVIRDSEGILWIGTYGGGLNRYRQGTDAFTHFQHRETDPASLSNNNIYALIEDSRQRLWVGTAHGLNRRSSSGGGFTRYYHDEKDLRSLPDSWINALYEDSHRILWIGTVRGLARYDIRTDTFLPPAPCQQDFSYRVLEIYEDFRHNLWIGTNSSGLFSTGPERKNLARYVHDPANPRSLGSSGIRVIMEDSRQNLWIGTHGGGLNRLDSDRETFHVYRQEDGLASNTVYGILESQDGFLWVSTNRGLCRFNPQSGQFWCYGKREGFLNSAFHPYSYHQDPDGKLYFGGSHGLIGFYPREIRPNRNIPPVVITAFYLFNRPVKPERPGADKTPSVLKQAIPYTRHITLSYRQNAVAFEFSALNYLHSWKNRYRYRLVGFDPEWIFTDHRHRRVTYTNLHPGRYTFRVQGSNNDGYWNETGAALDITIIPPFWETFLFKLLVIALLGLLLYYFYRLRMKKIMQKMKADARMELYCQRKNISNRELEIIRLILRGKSNREIEETLFISLNTVKNHLYNIYQKLNIENRHQLMALFNREMSSDQG